MRTGGLRAVQILLTVLLVVYGLGLVRWVTLLFGHGMAVIDGESLESVFGARAAQLVVVAAGTGRPRVRADRHAGVCPSARAASHALS